MKFKWFDSLKFKIISIFTLGIIIAFGINWYIAVQTIHAEKERDVQKVLHHLLIESTDEYIHEPLTLTSNMEFLYHIPHNKLILSDSEVSNIKFSITKYPANNNDRQIASSIRLENDIYLNAISDPSKIDNAVFKYGGKLLIRYLVSLMAVLMIVIFLLSHYMRPLSELANKIRSWRKEDSFDVIQNDAASEIKDVAYAFSSLVKRLENYRMKEAQLFKEAAHELKTPLALMRSRLDVYEESDHYDKTKFIAEFSRDVERLTTELKSVLFLESSDFEESTKIDVHEMLLGIKEKMDILVHRKQLIIDICEDTFTVFASKKLLYKVFSALIENATTYAMERSHIGIDIDPNHRSVQITNQIGNDKYLFSSKIGNKILNRLSKEIGYDYVIEDHDGVYSIKIIFSN